MSDTGPRIARRIVMTGRVQGVGYRPFVYRLAHEHALDGSRAQPARRRRGDRRPGRQAALDAFTRGLVDRAPPLAQPRVRAVAACDAPAGRGFEIAPSSAADAPEVSVPPDFFACDDCVAELADPADRRHALSVHQLHAVRPALHADRGAALRPSEHQHGGLPAVPGVPARVRGSARPPLPRRAGRVPGVRAAPHVRRTAGGDARHGRCRGRGRRGRRSLRDGRVLAVRGIGGYHLLCDACDEAAVRRLRERKRRPDKPLAVMFPQRGADGLDAAREELDDRRRRAGGARAIRRAPIVLVRAAGGRTTRARPWRPGLAEIGAFLPYSPLHHLLLSAFGGPVVATSGNVSGEPVLTEPARGRARLAAVADAFLHHDRPIVRPADDSVVRIAAGQAAPDPPRPRRGAARTRVAGRAAGAGARRGRAPEAHRRAGLGPARRGLAARRRHGHAAQRAGVRAGGARPAAALRRARAALAVRCAPGLHDHALGAVARASRSRRCCTTTRTPRRWSPSTACPSPRSCLPGTAWGTAADGSLWGGEAFVGRPGGWQRVASLRSFRLPGGDKAGRSPWRSAAALCWEAGVDCPVPVPDPIVRSAWERGLNAPRSSAAGRVFDALAAIVLGVTETSFEGQGPMWLEACAEPVDRFPVLPIAAGRRGRAANRLGAVARIVSATRWRSRSERAGAVHAALADAICRVAEAERARSGVTVAGLTGGVFQNRRLLELGGGGPRAARLHGCCCPGASRATTAA